MRHPSSLDFDVKDRHEVNLGTTVVTGSPLQALAHPEHPHPGAPPASPTAPHHSLAATSPHFKPPLQTLSQKPP